MNSTVQVSAIREKLLNDLQAVIQEAEQLVANTEQQTEYGYKAAIAQFERKLRHAKAELARLEQRVSASGKSMAAATHNLVEDHPWQAVGAAFGAGLLAGLAISLINGNGRR